MNFIETSVLVLATQSSEPATFNMTGGASISGTIVDTDNNPLSDLLVPGCLLKTSLQYREVHALKTMENL